MHEQFFRKGFWGFFGGVYLSLEIFGYLNRGLCTYLKFAQILATIGFQSFMEL